jgi:hypothetical protein
MKIEARKKLGKKPEVVLIVCEDTKSSAYYIEQKAKSIGLPIINSIKKININSSSVDIQGIGKAPITIVKEAIKKKKNFNYEAKRKQSYSYSKVFCIMDVDDHSSLADAIEIINVENQKDKETKIIPIISNECFEIWYILHFDYTTAELHRDSKAKRSKTKMFIPNNRNLSKLIEKYLVIDKYNKAANNIFQLLKSKGIESDAINNAKKLNQHHLSTNNISENEIYKFNPSTQVYKLICKLNEMSDNVLEFTFEDLKKTDFDEIKNLCEAEDFIAFLWHKLHQRYSRLTYSKRFELLKEVFYKPFYSRAYNEDEKIREHFNQYYQNN